MVDALGFPWVACWREALTKLRFQTGTGRGVRGEDRTNEWSIL